MAEENFRKLLPIEILIFGKKLLCKVRITESKGDMVGANVI